MPLSITHLTRGMTAGHELEADTRELHHTLSELLRIVQFRDRDRICCHDLSVSQCHALEAVAGAGPLRLNDLAAKLYLDKSTASRIVDALLRKRYLGRRRHPEDGRAILLEITAAGGEILRRVEADLLAEVRAVVAGFDPEVRRAIILLLGRLLRAAAARVEVEAGCCRLRACSE